MITNPYYIFVHIPKTAGSYIRNILSKYFEGEYNNSQYRFHAIPKNKSKQVIILSLRDPLEWYVSLYCHIIFYKNASGILPNECKRDLVSICGSEINNIENFHKFLKYIFNLKKGIVTNHHWWGENINYTKNINKGPYTLLFNLFKRSGVNYIINTNNIDDNIIKIFNKLNTTKKIKFNVEKFKNEHKKLEKINTKNHLYYKKYYTPELENLVKKKDSDIYNALNKFEKCI